MVSSLNFTTLKANSTDNDLMMSFFRKKALTFHANSVCMKCQTLFSGTNQKNISKCCLLIVFFVQLACVIIIFVAFIEVLQRCS